MKSEKCRTGFGSSGWVLESAPAWRLWAFTGLSLNQHFGSAVSCGGVSTSLCRNFSGRSFSQLHLFFSRCCLCSLLFVFLACACVTVCGRSSSQRSASISRTAETGDLAPPLQLQPAVAALLPSFSRVWFHHDTARTLTLQGRTACPQTALLCSCVAPTRTSSSTRLL